MGERESQPSSSLTRTTAAHRRELLRLLASLLSFALTYLVLIVGCTAAVVFTLFLAVEDSRFWLLASIVLAVVTANEIVGPLALRFALLRTGEAHRDRVRLIDFLQEEHIVTDFRARTKEEAIGKRYSYT